MRLQEETLEETSAGLREKAPEGLQRESIPSLRRTSARWSRWGWFWGMAAVVGFWILAGRAADHPHPSFLRALWQGLSVWLPWWSAGLLVSGLGLVAFEARWLQIDRQGIEVRYWWGRISLPWEEIDRVEGDRLYAKDGKSVRIPAGIEEREVLARLIRGVVSAEPLTLPEKLPVPPEDLLHRLLGPADARGRITLRCPQWLWSSSLQGCAGCLLWMTAPGLVGVLALLNPSWGDWGPRLLQTWEVAWLPLLLVFLWAQGRRRYPGHLRVDREGVELRYLLRRRRLAWKEILGATPTRLLTLSGPVPLLSNDEASQKLVSLVRTVRESQAAAVRLPPDDAERALAMVSPEESALSGREISEVAGKQERLTGRELEERR